MPLQVLIIFFPIGLGNLDQSVRLSICILCLTLSFPVAMPASRARVQAKQLANWLTTPRSLRHDRVSLV